ncbi:helix-turn-helix domain-containing protein [Mycolicibacterium sp.]|uniref:helix-turn-helix domain-containing protein n=1 Tax=Mycolicibacterium sp. TaxID=2320850 RepID=UPI0037C8AB98
MKNAPTPTPLSKLLVSLRTNAGLSTWKLAQRSGIDRSNIRRIESGVLANLTPATMQKLADALDVEVERFYEAHWLTTGQPLPSLPTYFRTKYRKLTDHQIAEIQDFVDKLQSENK